jgi:ADP-heptose:LPS heptosyltransferase
MAIGRFPILFITASRVGDAVLTSGLMHRLSEEIPHARFTVVASPLTAPLFRDVPNLDRLIPLEKEKASLHWFKLWRMVRGRRWGVIVDMRGSALSRFLNARRRAVKKPLAPGLEPLHKVIEAARVLRVEDDPPAPFLFTSAETEAAAQALLAGGEGPILAMAPAANWVGKTWPAERFAVVAAELLGPGGPMANGRLLLLGGPSDRFAAEAVRRVIPRARLIDTVGRVDLLTAYALLKHARLFIGNDSGLMHLAAAAGAPTLGLFGPSDERLYAPWGPKARALRGPREFETFKKIDPDLNQVVCHMFDLPTPWVTAAARKLFTETAEPVEAEIEAIDVEATEVALLEGSAAAELAEPDVAAVEEPELDVVEDPSPTSASA